MYNTEFSLVLFTLLGQFSAGMIVCLLVLNLIRKSGTGNKTGMLTHKGVYVATGVMIISMIISFFHLSSPLSAIYALSNLEQSWLSREILMVSLFTLLLVSMSAGLYLGKVKMKHLRILLTIASATGILMVFTMARLYMISTIPAWNNPSTLISFYASTLVLGASFVLILFYRLSSKQPTQDISLTFVAIIALVLIINLINTIYIGPEYYEGNIAFEPEVSVRLHSYLSWFFWVAGLVVLIRQTYSPAKSQKLFLNYQYIAFTCFFAAEIISRVLFYQSFYRIGI